jgi:hypothetical protein
MTKTFLQLHLPWVLEVAGGEGLLLGVTSVPPLQHYFSSHKPLDRLWTVFDLTSVNGHLEF